MVPQEGFEPRMNAGDLIDIDPGSREELRGPVPETLDPQPDVVRSSGS
jgi:hypothetical protein